MFDLDEKFGPFVGVSTLLRTGGFRLRNILQ